MDSFGGSTLSDSSSEDEASVNDDYQSPPSSFYSSAKKRKRSSSEEPIEETNVKPPPTKVRVATLKCVSDHLTTTKKKMVVSTIAERLMQSMGYKEGTGLGKNNQGRVEIIEASKQRGRRGFGLHLSGLDPSGEIDWKKEEVNLMENVEWMDECTLDPPPMNELRSWVKEGPKKLTIDDETEFCNEKIVGELLNLKNVFDSLEPEELRRARTRCNPYEIIRGVIFLNRAAMKMANMDCMFEFMFTSPVTESGAPAVGSNELLYFADICAGPGGFSEYVLWRKKWEAKGFGFTLKGQNDFKLEEFFAGTPESFEPYYGVGGIDGDGNIFSPENLREFRRFVLDNTDNKGVHFVMADGGFSVEGQENIQEILSKQLYLCQFLCALSIIRPGGHFVCKLFDLFTPFSVGLVYLLYRAFKRVCIVKPNTSRPANSERYVVCKWRRSETRDIEDYLFETNCRLERLKSSIETTDIIEIVPLHILKDDIQFYNYIVSSNETLGQIQCIHLAKIQAFCRNSELNEERQSDIRKECLKLWNIPDKVRSAPTRPEPSTKFAEFFSSEDRNYLTYLAEPLDRKKLDSIKSIYDYRAVVSSVDRQNQADRCFLLGLGRTNVFRWDGTEKSVWKKLELTVEIPRDTLLYVEIVHELTGEGKGQRKVACLHVVDALVLGGRDVRHEHYCERINKAQKLAKAISKPSRSDYTAVRVKQVYRFEEMEDIFDKLDFRMFKGSAGGKRLCYCSQQDKKYFLPHGIIFFKTVKDPWTMSISRSTGNKYFFNTRTRESRFDVPKDAIATFKDTFSSRLLWTWERGVKIHEAHTEELEDRVHRHVILDKIKYHLEQFR